MAGHCTLHVAFHTSITAAYRCSYHGNGYKPRPCRGLNPIVYMSGGRFRVSCALDGSWWNVKRKRRTLQASGNIQNSAQLRQHGSRQNGKPKRQALQSICASTRAHSCGKPPLLCEPVYPSSACVEARGVAHAGAAYHASAQRPTASYSVEHCSLERPDRSA